jgi:hypothetical protein
MSASETSSPLVVVESPDAINGSEWMDARQAAYYTSAYVSTIRRACREDVLRHIRIGHPRGPIRTRAEWIDAWMMCGVQEPIVN